MQIDNQLPDAVFPVVLQTSPSEKRSEVRPSIQLFVRRLFASRNKPDAFK